MAKLLEERSCIFGCEMSIGRFAMDKGCVCYPDKEQDLCAQHLINCTPIGSLELIKVYAVDHPLIQKMFPGGPITVDPELCDCGHPIWEEEDRVSCGGCGEQLCRECEDDHACENN